ncbi:MAG: hypothetical protein QOJ87_2330 [Verrucomicrobiota bacterium]
MLSRGSNVEELYCPDAARVFCRSIVAAGDGRLYNLFLREES